MNGGMIHYLRWIVEAYDGAAVVTTVDAAMGIIELRIAPGCEDVIDNLIVSLANRESVILKCIR